MIVTPVNWYQVSSPLKLMMDRLVCADGGNPDPTRTHGKSASEEDRTGGLGLPETPGGPSVRSGGAWRRGRGRERSAQHLGLALLHAPFPGRAACRAGPLY